MNNPKQNMRQVTIRQLQAHISEELRNLPFIIIRRGKPVATVVDLAQVSGGGVCTGKGSIEEVLGSKGLTKEEKRVALRKIIENPKTRDADKVKAIAEDNRLDSSMNETGNKPGRLGGDRGAEDIKLLKQAQYEAIQAVEAAMSNVGSQASDGPD